MPLGPGIGVDWETGDPEEPRRVPDRAEQARLRQWESVNRATELRSALASDEGSMLICYITDRLADRIDILVHQDQECVAYLKVLAEVNRELAVGQQAAQALMGLPLREAQRGHPTGRRE